MTSHSRARTLQGHVATNGDHAVSTIGETLESIKDTVLARMRNPFVGAFVLGWLAINWRYPYVTFVMAASELPLLPNGSVLPDGTKERYADKLTYMAQGIPFDSLRLVWLPLLAAAVVPFAAKVMGEVMALGIDWMSHRVKKTRSVWFKDEYSTLKETAEVRAQLEQSLAEEQKYKAERDRSRSQADAHALTIEELKRDVSGARDGAQNLQNDLNRANGELADSRKALEASEARIEQLERARAIDQEAMAAARHQMEVHERLQHDLDLRIEAQQKIHALGQSVASGLAHSFENVFPGSWVKTFSKLGSEEARFNGYQYSIAGGATWVLQAASVSQDSELLYFEQASNPAGTSCHVFVVPVSPTRFVGLELVVQSNKTVTIKDVSYTAKEVSDSEAHVST